MQTKNQILESIRLESIRKVLFSAFVLTMLSSCSDDNEPNIDQANNLIGTWDSEEVTIYEISINGIDIATYFLQLGYPTNTTDQIKEAIQNGATEAHEMELQFHTKGFYEAVHELGNDAGTWELIENGDKVLFDKGTSEEYEMTILELSESVFRSTVVATDNSDDYDGDGINDEVSITVILSMYKLK